jgi:hypothetical protein
MLDVREEPRDEDDIDRGITDHLVGDMDIAALRISRDRGHTGSVMLGHKVLLADPGALRGMR